MSTLAEIEAAIPQLTASELAELEQFVHEAKLGKMTVPPADKRVAVAAFLKRWTGAGVPMTDEEMDAQRTAYLMQKHVK